MEINYDKKELKYIFKDIFKELVSSGEITFKLNTFEDSYNKNIFMNIYIDNEELEGIGIDDCGCTIDYK